MTQGYRRLVGRVLSAILLLFASGCSKRPKDAVAENTTAQKVTLTPAAGSVPAGAVSQELIAAAASRASPSVVSVATTRVARTEASELPFADDPLFRRFFGPRSPLPFPPPRSGERTERGLGSGVIVGPDIILTNAHVVEGAKELEITGQNKRVLKAKIVGTDAKSDLAVLRIEGDTSGLTPIAFGDSSTLRLGQIVLAIGNPFGIGQTVTMGIVSGTSRADLGIEAYEDFIQTDAAINPGNSGGALVDLEGRLVGVPTAILSRTGGYMGVGFAIPSNMAQPIMKSLIEHGRVERGIIGVTIQNIDSDLASSLGLKTLDGVLVSDVADSGPAAKAGIRPGDVVLSIDGKKVQTTGELRNVVAASTIGKAVQVEYLRSGQKRTASVLIERQPTEEGSTPKNDADTTDGSMGLVLAPLDEAIRKKLEAPPSVRGVVVVSVRAGSPAAEAGLEQGDIVVEVGQKAVTRPDELARQWRDAKGALALLVWRGGHTFFAVLKR
jgi:serine protease Do